MENESAILDVFLNLKLEKTMMKLMMVGIRLVTALSMSSVVAQETVKSGAPIVEEKDSLAARELAFRKSSRIEAGQTVAYKIIVTQEEFETLKKAKPDLRFSESQIGDVKVIEEDSAVNFLPGSSKTQDVIAVKHTIYKREVPFSGYEQLLARSKKPAITKMMIGDSVAFIELSAEEISARQAVAPPHKELKGLSFPSFQLKTADGRELNEKVFKSKLTLVNFFFDKCAPCIEETPALNQFAKDYPEIQVLAMTFDKLAQVQKYVEEHHFAWPIVSDAGKVIANDLEVHGFPSFILVDENGMILGEQTGGDSSGDVSKKLHDWILSLRSQSAK